MNIKNLHCLHRHGIETHPNCFAKGLIKYPDAKTYEKFSGKPWYTYSGYKIGYIDIETDGLKADFSTMLSWCIKDKDGGYTYSVITKEELFNGTVDKRLVKELVDKMNEYAILVGYYSTNFDLPYIRTKAIHYDIDFPAYATIYHFDLYYTVKSKTCLSRKSLDNACQYFNINGKTPLDKNVWRSAKYGDRNSLLQVLEHNKYDCAILEELHDKLEFTKKWIKTSI